MSRTPQGVRGLKLHIRGTSSGRKKSHPARGAWIEILSLSRLTSPLACRTPQGVRGLKSGMLPDPESGKKSHPARGAWIEIPYPLFAGDREAVAPRKGCVD